MLSILKSFIEVAPLKLVAISMMPSVYRIWICKKRVNHYLCNKLHAMASDMTICQTIQMTYSMIVKDYNVQ